MAQIALGLKGALQFSFPTRPVSEPVQDWDCVVVYPFKTLVGSCGPEVSISCFWVSTLILVSPLLVAFPYTPCAPSVSVLLTTQWPLPPKPVSRGPFPQKKLGFSVEFYFSVQTCLMFHPAAGSKPKKVSVHRGKPGNSWWEASVALYKEMKQLPTHNTSLFHSLEDSVTAMR